VESLRTVIGSTIGSTELTKSGCGLMHRILLVCETGPVSTVDEEDRHWKGCNELISKSNTGEEGNGKYLLFPKINSKIPAIFMAKAPKK
jgi:hypothetical protein